jgi:SAM-dependent methyltransferase
MLGVDISPFFAAEAVERADLILGDLRKLPLRSNMFTKAWSLDVLEHLSPQALRDMLTEANRVLAPGGALFVYTHVRKNGWPARGVRLVNRLARLCERIGLLDLRQERLRKSDHLNPIADHDELTRVTRACGFEIERITYYSPIAGAFVENILVRMAERFLATRAAKRAGTSAAADNAASVRTARATAQARVRRGGLLYRGLVAVTAVMKVDIWLFGGIPSGPFFALLRKTSAADVPAVRVEAAV